MNKHIFRFRCFAERNGQQWNAICIDLGIEAMGRSYLDARTNLHSAMRDCVHDILFGIEPAEMMHMSRRQHLLRHRLKYAALIVLSKLAHSKHASAMTFCEQTACTYMSTDQRSLRSNA